jgi:predicted chitinase
VSAPPTVGSPIGGPQTTPGQPAPLPGGAATPQVQPSVDRILKAVRAVITLEVLKAVMPLLSDKKAAEFLPLLTSAMAEAGITTPQRQAAFMAQLAHESGQFRHMQEIADGSKYEGRRDLGNVNPGDGPLYKGRGPIQLTGRANYQAAGEALGLDLEANPQQVADPKVGFRTAAWYWESRGLNELADDGNFREITRRINGGFNGMADRERYHAAAKEALGL